MQSELLKISFADVIMHALAIDHDYCLELIYESVPILESKTSKEAKGEKDNSHSRCPNPSSKHDDSPERVESTIRRTR